MKKAKPTAVIDPPAQVQPAPVSRPRKFICYLCPRHDPFYTREDFMAHLAKEHWKP